MNEPLKGQVALVTGAARGMGRSHAIELAKAGADIIAVDICADLGMVYPAATERDLAETVSAIEALDRRVYSARADVRDESELTSVVDAGVSALGRLDIAIANAGIGSAPYANVDLPATVWRDMLDSNLTGVWITSKVATKHIVAGGRGGSIVLISSVAGIRPLAQIPHYSAAKAGVLQLAKSLAVELGPNRIRVNSIHPTNVKTDMIMHNSMYRMFRPDLENPTQLDFEEAAATTHVLPIPYVESIDVSNAVVFLVSETGRYITGIGLPVDGGMVLK
ncbi:MAG: SDR family mycofactocin-dependent oxidoreductase [Gordonia sp.]|nr:SDR family mycofactocin-dependent oxidoreductase [Gordonia sp. (in: high G+C Gram-positive bacteria)]